jgi:hypothetical protein
MGFTQDVVTKLTACMNDSDFAQGEKRWLIVS